MARIASRAQPESTHPHPTRRRVPPVPPGLTRIVGLRRAPLVHQARLRARVHLHAIQFARRDPTTVGDTAIIAMLVLI